MIYPSFLKKGNTIGICAPSCGIDKEDDRFDIALNKIREEGYNIIETDNVRTGLSPSSDAKTRAKEFNELYENDNVSLIYSASGGDFLMEVLPYIDESLIKEKINQNKSKWFCGYSDPTSLLFYLTTKFDIASLYGCNAGSFDQPNLYRNLKDNLEIIKGNIVRQDKFEKYQVLSKEDKENMVLDEYLLNTDVKWKNLNGDIDIKGRIIGGCIDCLKFLVGTKFDYVNDFINRYSKDGIIWYFDNFALKSEELYETLWQMQNAGWFEHTIGFIFGRTLFEGSFLDLSYEDAIKRALGNEVPIVYDADIGHVRPTFSVINGSIAHFVSNDKEGYLEMLCE